MNSREIKSQAKLIAAKFLREFSTCKYVPHGYVMDFVSLYTQDPEVKKEAFNQVRRAVDKLQSMTIYPRLWLS